MAAPVPLVPPAAVTVTLIVPAEPAGDVAVICVALLTVNDAALVAPNRTADTPVKLVPVMTTVVPPAARPDAGLKFVTVGGGAGGLRQLFAEATLASVMLEMLFQRPLAGFVAVQQ